jgi:hypothetical protein
MASRVTARRQRLLCDGDRRRHSEKTAEHGSLDYGGGRRVSVATLRTVTLRGAMGKCGGLRQREERRANKCGGLRPRETI